MPPTFPPKKNLTHQSNFRFVDSKNTTISLKGESEVQESAKKVKWREKQRKEIEGREVVQGGKIGE